MSNPGDYPLDEDADVDYTFYQIAVDKALVSTAGNCGNISSGVGPFAIEKGLVKAREPITAVRIYNTNTSKVIIEEVPCVNQSVKYDGETVSLSPSIGNFQFPCKSHYWIRENRVI